MSVSVENTKKNLTHSDMRAPFTQEKAKQVVLAINRQSSTQVTAATLTETKIMEGAGRIKACRALITGGLPASGESMTFDVKIEGVSALSAVVTIDSSSVVDTWYEATVSPAAAAFVLGSKVTFVRTYTAGGGPTPMTDTLLVWDFEYND